MDATGDSDDRNSGGSRSPADYDSDENQRELEFLHKEMDRLLDEVRRDREELDIWDGRHFVKHETKKKVFEEEEEESDDTFNISVLPKLVKAFSPRRFLGGSGFKGFQTQMVPLPLSDAAKVCIPLGRKSLEDFRMVEAGESGVAQVLREVRVRVRRAVKLAEAPVVMYFAEALVPTLHKYLVDSSSRIQNEALQTLLALSDVGQPASDGFPSWRIASYLFETSTLNIFQSIFLKHNRRQTAMGILTLIARLGTAGRWGLAQGTESMAFDVLTPETAGIMFFSILKLIQEHDLSMLHLCAALDCLNLLFPRIMVAQAPISLAEVSRGVAVVLNLAVLHTPMQGPKYTTAGAIWQEVEAFQRLQALDEMIAALPVAAAATSAAAARPPPSVVKLSTQQSEELQELHAAVEGFNARLEAAATGDGGEADGADPGGEAGGGAAGKGGEGGVGAGDDASEGGTTAGHTVTDADAVTEVPGAAGQATEDPGATQGPSVKEESADDLFIDLDAVGDAGTDSQQPRTPASPQPATPTSPARMEEIFPEATPPQTRTPSPEPNPGGEGCPPLPTLDDIRCRVLDLVIAAVLLLCKRGGELDASPRKGMNRLVKEGGLLELILLLLTSWHPGVHARATAVVSWMAQGFKTVVLRLIDRGLMTVLADSVRGAAVTVPGRGVRVAALAKLVLDMQFRSHKMATRVTGSQREPLPVVMLQNSLERLDNLIRQRYSAPGPGGEVAKVVMTYDPIQIHAYLDQHKGDPAYDLLADYGGASPLMLAASRSSPLVLRELVQFGAMSNQQGLSSALHFAVAFARGENIAELVKMGSDISALDVEGKTPQEFARARALLVGMWQTTPLQVEDLKAPVLKSKRQGPAPRPASNRFGLDPSGFDFAGVSRLLEDLSRRTKSKSQLLAGGGGGTTASGGELVGSATVSGNGAAAATFTLASPKARRKKAMAAIKMSLAVKRSQGKASPEQHSPAAREDAAPQFKLLDQHDSDASEGDTDEGRSDLDVDGEDATDETVEIDDADLDILETIIAKPTQMRSEQELEEILQFAQGIAALRRVPAPVRRAACRQFEYVTLPEKTVLCQRGDYIKEMWLLLKGSMVVFDAQGPRLATPLYGIGFPALLQPESQPLLRHVRSLVTKTECKFLKLDRVVGCAAVKAAHEMERERRVLFCLKQFPPPPHVLGQKKEEAEAAFRNLIRPQLQACTNSFISKKFLAGDVIHAQGGRVRGVYFVYQGEVEAQMELDFVRLNRSRDARCPPPQADSGEGASDPRRGSTGLVGTANPVNFTPEFARASFLDTSTVHGAPRMRKCLRLLAMAQGECFGEVEVWGKCPRWNVFHVAVTDVELFFVATEPFTTKIPYAFQEVLRAHAVVKERRRRMNAISMLEVLRREGWGANEDVGVLHPLFVAEVVWTEDDEWASRVGVGPPRPAGSIDDPGRSKAEAERAAAIARARAAHRARQGPGTRAKITHVRNNATLPPSDPNRSPEHPRPRRHSSSSPLRSPLPARARAEAAPE